MKRILTGVALVTTAALATATPAMAAPKDPVVAVKKRMAPGKGVSFTERTTISQGARREVFLRRSGTLQFGKSGIAASDITGKLNITSKDLADAPDDEFGESLKAIAKPERTIKIGTTSYLSGNMWATLLPEGKTWFKAAKGLAGGATATFGQFVNLGEHSTLKALLKGAKATSHGYTGTIKLGALWKASPWLRAGSSLGSPSAKAMKSPIKWRLTVNAAGLPTRLVTTFTTSVHGLGDKGSVSVDTRYTGWGKAVSIKAPPAKDVATSFEDSGDDIPSLTEIPLGAYAVTG
ncbi:hypothetical protein FE391_15920 [Nonomuraea sp. KC401]|uniref:hypothetical protein n=1 Tax=unclassified Nonomuraea TaxID=2593643 RepID=UPI0010FDB87E|nr:MULTISPECIES: hypothetical protein [unclassified Nonomuraea]NBE92783.1 hypothetical protein [Nonomuraea sp. K271]TLF73018.1 hypothetical protein FE391_15920 [Nonomuraea sp. KC401]